MARVTVEDCIDKVDSPYELVLVAKERATQLNSGVEPTLEKNNDKNTVIALREIAEETLSSEQLKNDLIQEYQTNTFNEDEDLNEIEDNSDEIQNETKEIETVELDQDSDPSLVDTQIDTSQDNLHNSSDEEKVQES